MAYDKVTWPFLFYAFRKLFFKVYKMFFMDAKIVLIASGDSLS